MVVYTRSLPCAAPARGGGGEPAEAIGGFRVVLVVGLCGDVVGEHRVVAAHEYLLRELGGEPAVRFGVVPFGDVGGPSTCVRPLAVDCTTRARASQCSVSLPSVTRKMSNATSAAGPKP